MASTPHPGYLVPVATCFQRHSPGTRTYGILGFQ